MEFIPVTTGLWDDSWIMQLCPHHKLLWLYLCTSPNNDYGFIEYHPVLWAFRTGLTVEQIDDALNVFVDSGRVARSGNIVLLVKNLQHRRLRGKNMDGAIAAIRERYSARYPDLVEKCLVHNGVIFKTTGLLQDKTREEKTREENTCNVSDETHPLYELVSELRRMIVESCGTGKAPSNPLKKCLTIVDQVIRLDKVPQADLVPMLKWALADPFWGGKRLILGIPHWRKAGRNGYPKIHNCWIGWRERNGGGQITEREAAERRREERGL